MVLGGGAGAVRLDVWPFPWFWSVCLRRRFGSLATALRKALFLILLEVTQKKQVGFLQFPGWITVGEHITQQIDAVSYQVY